MTEQLHKDHWSKALWCPYADDHRCAANIIEACICRRMPHSVYQEAVNRAKGEPTPGGEP